MRTSSFFAAVVVVSMLVVASSAYAGEEDPAWLPDPAWQEAFRWKHLYPRDTSNENDSEPVPAMETCSGAHSYYSAVSHRCETFPTY